MGKKKYLEDAYDIYFNAVSSIAGSRFELALWSAWGYGAIAIEGGLLPIPEFNIAPDSLEKAKCVANLFIQPMISIWYHKWETQEPHSVEEMFEAREIAFGNVQTFLGRHSSEMLSIHFILDVELTYRLNNLKKSSFDYIGMFHQRYRECVNQERIVDWNKLKVPIETSQDFINCCDRNRLKSLDANSSIAAFAAIGYAGARMFEEFKRIQGRSK